MLQDVKGFYPWQYYEATTAPVGAPCFLLNLADDCCSACLTFGKSGNSVLTDTPALCDWPSANLSKTVVAISEIT